MKQFKLREEKTFVKILKEPPTLKQKVNWSRRFYLLIFIFVAFLFTKRVYMANMIIIANGQLELPKQTVKFPNDIKVLNLNVSTGQEVCEGDTLFAFKNMGDQLDQARVTMRTSNPNEWILREQLALRKKIELSELLIEQKNKNLNYFDEIILKKESLLLGGIHEEYNQYSNMLDKKAKLISEIDYHKHEIEILKKHIAQLYVQKKLYSDINIGELGIYDEVQYFISPLDGVISDVFYEANEICYKKEEMITIHQLTNATINTFFDPEEIRYLEIGDMVDIEFPDKSQTKGVISKFFVSTYALPSEFQKKYEPTERNIVAEVLPVNKVDEQTWNSFYKMDVIIEKSRYELPF